MDYGVLDYRYYDYPRFPRTLEPTLEQKEEDRDN